MEDIGCGSFVDMKRRTEISLTGGLPQTNLHIDYPRRRRRRNIHCGMKHVYHYKNWCKNMWPSSSSPSNCNMLTSVLVYKMLQPFGMPSTVLSVSYFHLFGSLAFKTVLSRFTYRHCLYSLMLLQSKDNYGSDHSSSFQIVYGSLVRVTWSEHGLSLWSQFITMQVSDPHKELLNVMT